MNNDLENLKQLEETNYKLISDKIENLKNYWESGNKDFKDFWNSARDITELFKTVKPLSRFDREELWNNYEDLCKEVKFAQNLQFDSRKTASHLLSEFIQQEITNASSLLTDAASLETLDESDTILNNALDIMKSGSSALDRSLLQQLNIPKDIKLLHEDNEECWLKLKEAKALIKSKRSGFYETNYLFYLKEVEDVLKISDSEDVFATKDKIEQLQNDIKDVPLSSEQFREIKNILRTALDKVRERIKESKKSLIITDEDRLKSLSALIEKNLEVIERLKSQIQECLIIQKGAESYEFAMKVKGWIDEKNEKIKSILETNSNLEQKITDIKVK